MNRIAVIFSFLLLTVQARPDTTLVNTPVLIDTVLYQHTEVLTPYTPVTDSENLEKHLSQNPTAALFKSLIIPGLGQIGNRRYVKAGLFVGLDAWFIGSAIHYGRQASEFKRQYKSAVIGNRNDYYDLYLDRKDERNKFTWFSVIIAFVSMFDAYVDAHLSGFPRKADKGGINLSLYPSSKGEMVACVVLSF